MFQELGAPVCRVMSPCFLYSRGAPKSCSDPLFVGLQTQIAKDVLSPLFSPCILLAVGLGLTPRSGAVGER